MERIIGLAWCLRRAGQLETEALGAQASAVLAQRRSPNTLSNQCTKNAVAITLALRNDREATAMAKDSGGLAGELPKEVWAKAEELKSKDPEVIAALQRQRERESRTAKMGEAFLRDSKQENAMAKLTRYEASIERSFYKALHELQRMQAVRQGKEVPLPVAVDVDVGHRTTDKLKLHWQKPGSALLSFFSPFPIALLRPRWRSAYI